MGLYSISGVDCDCCNIGYDDYTPSAVISGKRKTARKQRRATRKATRKAKRTGVNCKGSKLKKVALAVPRNAFLSLVRLNVRKFAVKLYNAMKNPDKERRLMEKWCKLGGDASSLRSAVNKAFSKYSRKRNIGDPTGTTETIIATATPVIVALLEFLKKGANEEPVTADAEPVTETETTETQEATEPEGNTVEGVLGIDPYLFAGMVGVGVYFLTKKRFI